MVKVVKAKNSSSVVNKSSNANSDSGWVMLTSTETVIRQGAVFHNVRNGFLRARYDELLNMNLSTELKALGINCPDTGIGFKEGQELTGHICIQDSLEPIMKENPSFGLRIPRLGKTPEIRAAVQNLCKEKGVSYEGVNADGELKPIYRKVFYSPYPVGHERYESDNIIPIANREQVNDFIAHNMGNGDEALKASRDARIAELKAIPKAKRTPEQVTELADLLEA